MAQIDSDQWGNVMRMRLVCGAAITASLLSFGAANAAAYNFSVLWNGTTASLAGGSDDPLTTTMNAGDSFTYSLSATGGGKWNTILAGSLFPLFSMPLAESGTRTGDLSLNLLNGVTNVFSYSENGASNSFVHLGTNTVSIASGLMFDSWVLNYNILTADTTSTPTSLLPWPGNAPEAQFGDNITFTAGGVPEPATWALMISGFGLVGATLRRRKAIAA